MSSSSSSSSTSQQSQATGGAPEREVPATQRETYLGSSLGRAFMATMSDMHNNEELHQNRDKSLELAQKCINFFEEVNIKDQRSNISEVIKHLIASVLIMRVLSLLSQIT